MKTKRLFIATLFGVLTGYICYLMASSGGKELPLFLTLNIILGRTMAGFGIGISRFRIKHWALHGLVMGFVFSLPMAFGVMLGPENPEFTQKEMFIATMIMGMIYGVLIEFFTSIVFKAKQ